MPVIIFVPMVVAFLTSYCMMRWQLKMFERWIDEFFEREVEEMKRLIR